MMPVIRRSLLILGCLFAASCNSNSPYYQILITAPEVVSLAPGESAQFDLTLERDGDELGELRVNLESEPEGITLAPEVVLPAGETLVTTPVTLTVAQDIQVTGTQRMLLLATNAVNDIESGATFYVVVQPPPQTQPDFAIALENRQLELFAGQSEFVRVTITRTAPFAGPVTLSIESPTLRITATPLVVTPEQTTVNFNIDTQTSTTRIPIPIAIVATSEDGRQVKTGLTLNVR
ncbi:hypothetical protein [Myxococcus qinghaiensis]|uniref:hypothetical protein n=1 Tax=Myxococcus qinghaiensis TaxID=2906758 RepID=UPI0020A7115E|nr:hypothetical protein [Myxococcus qinghaiensis]MCP3163011.1 hypothetical protein [Myxococcus qinghaiensis]